MTLHFHKQLSESLSTIKFDIPSNNHKIFTVHDLEEERSHHNSDHIINKYGEVKWAVVDLLNTHYSKQLSKPFDLYHWLEFNDEDEVSYFLSETGSNALSYSQFKTPSNFQVWLGEKGFVIGIEQKGKGFNAQDIHHQKIKENEGAAFDFFRKAKNTIFFDNSINARIIYIEHLL